MYSVTYPKFHMLIPLNITSSTNDINHCLLSLTPFPFFPFLRSQRSSSSRHGLIESPGKKKKKTSTGGDKPGNLGEVTHGKPTPSWGKQAKKYAKTVGCSEPHMAFSACWSKILDWVFNGAISPTKQKCYNQGDFRRCVSLLNPTHLIDE